jgi:hypothetical protein
MPKLLKRPTATTARKPPHGLNAPDPRREQIFEMYRRLLYRPWTSRSITVLSDRCLVCRVEVKTCYRSTPRRYLVQYRTAPWAPRKSVSREHCLSQPKAPSDGLLRASSATPLQEVIASPEATAAQGRILPSGNIQDDGCGNRYITLGTYMMSNLNRFSRKGFIRHDTGGAERSRPLRLVVSGDR